MYMYMIVVDIVSGTGCHAREYLYLFVYIWYVGTEYRGHVSLQVCGSYNGGTVVSIFFYLDTR